MKTNKKNNKMTLFCKMKGLSIEYDEGNNTFKYRQLSVCDDIKDFHKYAYVCINDVILFFGGHYNKSDYKYENGFVSKSVYKYSIGKNKWTTFQNILPNPLYDCVAIWNEEDNNIYIIGGEDNRYAK
ncbi:hypothetical protein RFI_38715, partial [Reticulomyxa filosa]